MNPGNAPDAPADSGGDYDLLPYPSLPFAYTQPAHLAQLEGRPLTDPDLPIARAQYVRRMLEADAARTSRGPQEKNP